MRVCGGAGDRHPAECVGVLEPDPGVKELTLTRLPEVVEVEQVRASTGWPLRVADVLAVTDPPPPRSWTHSESSARAEQPDDGGQMRSVFRDGSLVTIPEVKRLGLVLRMEVLRNG
jgi:hypothetical protein